MMPLFPLCIYKMTYIPIDDFIVTLHVESEVNESHGFTGPDLQRQQILRFVFCHLRHFVLVLPPPITLLIPATRADSYLLVALSCSALHAVKISPS